MFWIGAYVLLAISAVEERKVDLESLMYRKLNEQRRYWLALLK